MSKSTVPTAHQIDQLLRKAALTNGKNASLIKEMSDMIISLDRSNRELRVIRDTYQRTEEMNITRLREKNQTIRRLEAELADERGEDESGFGTK